MNADILLTKAKSQLTTKHPYFGMLASRLKHEENESIRAYASNGKRFLYNPAFVESCSIEELSFVLTNCVMHHILSHQQRKLKRKGFLWQLATDFAINNLLFKNGVKIPKGANFDKKYKNMYAEEIYEELKKERIEAGFDAFEEDVNEKKQEQNDENKFTKVKNIEENLDERDEEQWEYASTLAKEVAIRKSLMPLGFERLAKKVEAKNIDWKFELYNAINRHMRNNYAFMPPNKKHLYRGFALPSLTSDTLSLIVAIDTSGSIQEEILGAFVEEFKTIMQNFPAVNIELLIADAKIQGHYSFKNAQDIDFVLKGGGGTDYRPVFDYIDANFPMSSMLLYFTDGDGIFPRIPPSYEVLWALSNRKDRIPFGRSIVIF
ncbi:MAG: VWA-like domain-containing protein [Arcobacter sp.]|jgi:predicted metal-dependent peptidase|uniref:vWA domain-containing protein n=1 Tax=Arcobacter sp. TaxID=1872629 RepID=UPI002A74B2B4|nr:VWA-like domain-containing protein [Arcobacter sp.]MDY3200099.1 VWA-like domain-containing protein [Arcobacter sp.]